MTIEIGQNSTPGEIFQLSDAQDLLTFANNNPYITRLSMWSMSRDNGSCAGSTTLQSSCSGLSQSNNAFSQIFETF